MLKIPADERIITDAEVFSAFDLNYPGLESVRTALDAGNMPAAKTALVHYFETRTNVKYYCDYRALPLRAIDTDSNPYLFQSSMGLAGSLKDFCLFAGRKMMNHIYVIPGRDRREVDLGSGYENLPHYNFFDDQLKKGRQTLDIFVRGVFCEYYSVLYHETGDAAVVKDAEKFLKLFWQTYPLMAEYTEPDISHFSLTEERDVMSAGWLAFNYISLLYTRVAYEMPVATTFELIKHLWFLGIQFRRFDTDSYRKFNHHMWERGIVPFALGTLFPEIPAFGAMKDHGAAVVRQHIRDDFSTEGGYSEHSISYWFGAALGEMVCRAVYIARLNNEPLLDEDTRERIEKSFSVTAAIAAPGELYPAMGDNSNPQIEPVLQAGIDAMQNHDCAVVMAVRHGQTIPEKADIPLDYCNDKVGFFCTRSGLTGDANYLLMSAKVSCGDTGHNHMDMLSVAVSVHGQEIIGEPYSRPLYHIVPVGDALRGYEYNMSSHNTVLVNGIPVQPDFIYAAKWGVIRPDSPVETFISEKNGCFVRACHSAYTHSRHVRKVLADRKKGFLIQDEIQGGNRTREPHIQRWNLMHDITCTQLDSRSVLLEKNGTRTLMLWDGSPTLRIWQKEELRPRIVKPGEPLTDIIDVSFRDENKFIPAGGLEPVRQSVLILDVTGGMPKIDDVNAFCARMMENAEAGNLSESLNLFAEI